MYQGEFLADGKPLTEARRVKNPRQYVGFTQGYNRALCVQRAHDVLSVVSWLRNEEPLRSEVVAAIGPKGTAPWAAVALAQARGGVDRAALDTAGFRFASLNSLWDMNLVPGIVKYGDLPGLLSLASPAKLWLAGEGSEVPAIIAASYRAEGEGRAVAATAPAAGQLAAALALAQRVNKTGRRQSSRRGRYVFSVTIRAEANGRCLLALEARTPKPLLGCSGSSAFNPHIDQAIQRHFHPLVEFVERLRLRHDRQMLASLIDARRRVFVGKVVVC